MLSVRERQVLYGLAAGLTMKEIAHRLGCSYDRVQESRLKVREKIGMWDGGDLAIVRAGIAQGVLPVDAMTIPAEQMLQMGGWIG